MAFFGYSPVGLMRAWRRQLANAEQTNEVLPFDWEWDERRDQYAEWEKLYANTVYAPQIEGGLREVVLRDVLGRQDYAEQRIIGVYNPVARIVDTYRNVLRGQWQRDIWPVDLDRGDPIPTDSPLARALNRIWRWSNWDTQKQVWQTWAALYGTVGLRIAVSDDLRRVRVMPERPARIVDYDADAEGNVTQVLLRYAELAGELGTGRRTVVVEELLSARRFRKSIDGQTVLDAENPLGVCPFVLVQHRDVGAEWGLPAFWGSEALIHAINWRLSRQDESIDQFSFPVWFGSGSGPKPTELSLAQRKLVYVQATADGPAPTLEPLVPQVDQGAATAYLDRLVARLLELQPELILSSIESLSGQSGETITQLLQPVAERIEDARSHYEAGLIRALRIGMAWAARLGLVEGIADAEALESDRLDFRFNERPALPPTVYDEVKLAEAETARRTRNIADAAAAGTFVSRREQLRIAGYSENEIARIEGEIAEQDVIPTAIEAAEQEQFVEE